MGNPESDHSRASWDSPSQDRYIEIKIRRNTLIAFFISLVIHGVVLFAFSMKKLAVTASVANQPPKNMSVRIVGLPSKKSLTVISLKEIKPKKPDVKPKPKLPTPSVIAAKNNKIIAAPRPVFTTPAENNAPTDLMSYINSKRERAQDLEDNAARENAAASANARRPSAEELRDANIKRNLQQPGTSGIFEIRKIAFRTGRFSFKGWKNKDSNPRLEIIDVEAGADDNINLAIVKKMIEIIRREYKGNFNWESQRLGRVIVLSARIEDNAGLEAFLMQEFFTAQEFYPRP
jgi:hypothetical protein